MGLKMANLKSYTADLKKHKSDYSKLKKWLKAFDKNYVLEALIGKVGNTRNDTFNMYDGAVYFEVGIDKTKNEVHAWMNPTRRFEYTLNYKADDYNDAKKALQTVIDKAIWWVDNYVMNAIGQ